MGSKLKNCIPFNKCCKSGSSGGSSEEVAGETVQRGETEGGRAQWASPTEFLLTCIGYSVGLGNVWRFPYLCYKSGGGAFLIPYVIMMILIGMPLLFMEYAFGQYFGVGSLTIFKKVCPMLQGVGIGYMVLNGLVCIYYNVIIATSLYYLFASFTANLPWGSCGHEWNTIHCGDPTSDVGNMSIAATSSGGEGTVDIDMATVNGTFENFTSTVFTTLAPLVGNKTSASAEYFKNITKSSPSDEFFRYALMDMHDEHSVENVGHIRAHLCLCLLLAWILVIIFVSRGIQSTGKVAYFTATFPYLMLTVLVVRGVTLQGATAGILYFVSPDWSKLADPDVWFGAATQLFYSTNLAWGGMITMSSYNTFSHNCYRDAIMINLVSFFTSLYAGFAVFSIIGYMAHEQGLEIEKVIDSGPGLAFIVYPRALSLMPLAPMWSALFFFMLFLLGIGSQMVLVETVVTGFADEFPVLSKNGCLRLLTTIGVAIFFFFCGLGMTAQMVQIETLMTGIVDQYTFLNKTKWTRLLTVIGLCSCGFMIGLACTAQMVDVETVMSGLCDEFPLLGKHRFPVLLVVCAIFFLFGIAQVTQGGMYVLQLMDHYSATFGVLIIAVVECVAINWCYGNEKFAANVKEMLGHYPVKWWRICWKYLSPLLIMGILIFSLIRYKRASYGEYTYPGWADGVGWCLALSSVLPIIIVAAVHLYQAEGDTLKAKYFKAIEPHLVEPQHPINTTEEKFLTPQKAKEADTIETIDESDAQKRSLLVNKVNTEVDTSAV